MKRIHIHVTRDASNTPIVDAAMDTLTAAKRLVQSLEDGVKGKFVTSLPSLTNAIRQADGVNRYAQRLQSAINSARDS